MDAIDAILVGWASKNSNNVGTRSVSAALYNVSYAVTSTVRDSSFEIEVVLTVHAPDAQMSVQLGSIIYANIYQDYDKPVYKDGNRTLIIINCLVIGAFLLTKVYYVWRNTQRERVWNAMTEDEKIAYANNTTITGSRRLDFRFAH